MEFRHIRYFVAVAEELSFSRAAKRLAIAQPPLSQQVQALEREIGTKLLNRNSRPIQLTLAGRTFLELSYSLMLQLERAVHTTQRVGRGEKGRLVVGFTSSIANSILPDLWREFGDSFSQVDLQWRELSTYPQIQGLRDRQIDIGFFHFPEKATDYSDLNSQVVLSEPLWVVLPEHHPLATCPKISLTTLKNEKFVLPAKAVCTRNL